MKRISKVAYELEFPAKVAAVHPVFHISLVKKFVGDPAAVVPLESVVVKDSLTYELYQSRFLTFRSEGRETKKSLQSRFCRGVSP